MNTDGYNFACDNNSIPNLKHAVQLSNNQNCDQGGQSNYMNIYTEYDRRQSNQHQIEEVKNYNRTAHNIAHDVQMKSTKCPNLRQGVQLNDGGVKCMVGLPYYSLIIVAGESRLHFFDTSFNRYGLQLLAFWTSKFS